MNTHPANRAPGSPRQVARRIAERAGEEPRELKVKMVALEEVRRFIAGIRTAQARSNGKVMAVD